MRDPVQILALIEEKLEALLLDDENITARSVVRRMDGVLKHASDITRNADRRGLLERYQIKQADLRSVMERTGKASKRNTAIELAQKDARIEELSRDRDLLVASLRAAILAVGEMGGMGAWLRFYKAHEDALERLRTLGAMPSAHVSALLGKRNS